MNTKDGSVRYYYVKVIKNGTSTRVSKDEFIKHRKSTRGGDGSGTSTFYGMTFKYQDYNRVRIFTVDRSDVNETDMQNIRAFIDKYGNDINNLYTCGVAKHSNVCGDNSEAICTLLNTKSQKAIANKIIIREFKEVTSLPDKRVFGECRMTMRSVLYHALTRVVISTLYCALETTIKVDNTFLQIYVGKDEAELNRIIRTRYQIPDEFDFEVVGCSHRIWGVRSLPVYKRVSIQNVNTMAAATTRSVTSVILNTRVARLKSKSVWYWKRL